MTNHTAHMFLTIAGAACEIGGFSWSIANASIARRRELHEVGVLLKAVRKLLYWFEEPAEPVPLEGLGATASSGASMDHTIGHDTESERLQRQIDELRAALEGHRSETSKRFEMLKHQMDESAKQVDARVTTLGDSQREIRRSTFRYEIGAGCVFILGAVLSMLANLV